jgi:hypothetical protein
MLEKQLEAKIVKYCKAHDILCYKFTSPAHRGVPDRLLIKGGKVLFLEIKKKGCLPTTLQTHEICRLRDHGVPATWTDSYEDAVENISSYFGVV